MAEKELYDEWASGVSLANNSNDFFEELPMELSNPANFVVKPEDLPQDPTQPQPSQTVELTPTQTPLPEPDDKAEVIALEGGGTITVEKTGRGWRATLESGEHNIATENFYGNNKTQLIANLAKGKLEASKTIRRLKKEKLLGGDEPVAPTPSAPRNSAKVAQLTADDVYEIKNAMENPAEAFDVYIKKRFGLNPDEFADALKAAPEAQKVLEAQKIKANIDEINFEFVGRNPDWAEEYADSAENRRALIGRMAKAYLNKKITKNASQVIVDDTIYELYSRGFWTADNLETAKEELIDGGLLEKSTPPSEVPVPQPSPAVAPSAPSVAAAPRIAATPGQPVSFGTPARNSTPSAVPEPTLLADVDLQKLPMEQLRAIAAAQLREMKNQR